MTIDQQQTMAAVFLDYCQDILSDQDRAKDFQENLIVEEYSSSHINNSMKAIEYYYDFHAREFEYKRLKRPKKLPEVLSSNQVRRIIYVCETYRDYAVIKTLASSGIRSSELCALDVTDVDLDPRPTYSAKRSSA